ncbi:MAG: metallophosphoesterase, partial [Chitinophagaceae bacterium]|nr:metallophosphoesterase [Chitinophagaceae bacterium]
LYSNVAENPGYLSGGTAGSAQKKWLIKTLKEIRSKRNKGAHKALLLAVHHPPFSSGGHAGSSAMLQDIDDCCTQADLFPDAVLAAHAHNYQRYTRYLTISGTEWQVPYLVAGGGGRTAQPVKAADQRRVGDHSFDKSLQANGYLLIKATAEQLIFDFYQVKEGGVKSHFDHVTLDLTTHQLT